MFSWINNNVELNYKDEMDSKNGGIIKVVQEKCTEKRACMLNSQQNWVNKVCPKLCFRQLASYLFILSNRHYCTAAEVGDTRKLICHHTCTTSLSKINPKPLFLCLKCRKF